MTKIDRYFGQIAVKQGLITNENLKRCFLIQKKAKSYKKISKIVYEQGYLTKQQVNAVLHRVRLRLESSHGAKGGRQSSQPPARRVCDSPKTNRSAKARKRRIAGTIIRDRPANIPNNPTPATVIRNVADQGRVTPVASGKTAKRRAVPATFIRPMSQETIEDQQIGRLAIERKLITIDQLQQCILLQQKALRKGEQLRLGQIMVRKRFLEVNTLLALMKQCNLASSEQPPKTFGDYQIINEISHGPHAQLFKARSAHHSEFLALKVFHRDAAAELQQASPPIQVLRNLRHPNLVPLYEFGQLNGNFYCTMPFIPGQDLGQMIATLGKPDLRQACKIIEAIARALHYGHTQGIIHRNVKPAKILIHTNGTPKLTDLGLPGPLGLRRAEVAKHAYLSPEQTRLGTAKLDERTDIYSLGAVFYQLVTHHVPFQAEQVTDLYKKITTEEPLPPRHFNFHIPAPVEIIIAKAMEKRPVRRYNTARNLADDLARFLNGESIMAKPSGWLERLRKQIVRHPLASILILGLLSVLVLGGVLWHLNYCYHQQQAARQAAAKRRQVAALTQQGEVLLAQKKAAAALLAFERALALDPHCFKAQIGKGQALLESHKFRPALAALQQAATLSRESQRLLFLRCQAYRGNGQLREALKDINQLLNFSRGQYLFSVSSSSILQNRTRLPLTSLRLTLQQHHRQLSAQARLTTRETGREWLLQDPATHQEYLIVKTSHELNIYAYQNTDKWLLLRAAIYEEQQDYQQARADYSTLIDRTPDTSPAKTLYYIKRAHCNQQLNMKDLARSDLDRAIAIAPGNLAAYLARGRLFWDWQDMAKAKDDFSMIIRRARQNSALKAQAYYYRGQILLTQVELDYHPDDIQRAYDDFSQALACDPKMMKVHLPLGKLALICGDFKDSLVHVQTYLEHYPQQCEAMLLLGTIYQQTGKYKQAVAILNQVLQQDGRNPQALRYRGQAYRHLQQYQAAEADADKLCQHSSAGYQGYYLKAQIAADQKKLRRALHYYSLALEAAPDFLAACQARACLYQRMGQTVAARQDYQRLNELLQLTRARGKVKGALLYLRKAQRLMNMTAGLANTDTVPRPPNSSTLANEVVTLLKRALHLVPQLWQAHYYLACCYYHAGKNVQAQQHLAAALEQNPCSALVVNIYLLQARIYCQSSKPLKLQRALRLYRQALALAPDNRQVLKGLHRVYVKLGLTAQARKIKARLKQQDLSTRD